MEGIQASEKIISELSQDLHDMFDVTSEDQSIERRQVNGKPIAKQRIHPRAQVMPGPQGKLLLLEDGNKVVSQFRYAHSFYSVGKKEEEVTVVTKYKKIID